MFKKGAMSFEIEGSLSVTCGANSAGTEGAQPPGQSVTISITIRGAGSFEIHPRELDRELTVSYYFTTTSLLCFFELL